MILFLWNMNKMYFTNVLFREQEQVLEIKSVIVQMKHLVEVLEDKSAQ